MNVNNNGWDRGDVTGRTYRLSFGSRWSMRPRQTSVSLLSLLSRGSNETNKTWVSLLSLGTGVSTQTRQTRRSLQKDKKMKVVRRWKTFIYFICSLCQSVEWEYKWLMSYNRSGWSFLSSLAWSSLFTLKYRKRFSRWRWRSYNRHCTQKMYCPTVALTNTKIIQKIYWPLILGDLWDLLFLVFLVVPEGRQVQSFQGGQQHLGLPVNNDK